MRILATLPLHLMEVQVEIIKAFIFFLCKLSKYHEVTFVIFQKKKYKDFGKGGILGKLEDAGVKVKYIPSVISKISEQMFVVDNRNIMKALGTEYDLVLYYNFPISSDKQMRSNFKDLQSKEKVRVTFNSLLSKIGQTYPLYLLSTLQNIPTIQFVVDWLEPDLDKIYDTEVFKSGVYGHAKRNVKYLPIYDMYIFRKGKQNFTDKKEIDFVFGYTITFQGRKYLHDSIYNGIKENSSIKLFARDRYWGEGRNDVIPQTEYFREIEKARFSYILPANDRKEFSIQRFCECIARDCIPLIDSRCVLTEAFSDKQDIVEFYKKNNLIIDLEKEGVNLAVQRLLNDYNRLVKELNETTSIKKLFNVERYDKFVKNFEKFVKKYLQIP